jgi:hypothetical protein
MNWQGVEDRHVASFQISENNSRTDSVRPADAPYADVAIIGGL